MQHIETIAIDRPISDVWNLVGNPSNWGQWMDGMSDIRLEGEIRQGASLTYSWRGKERKATVTRFMHEEEIAVKGEETNYSHSESILVHGMGSTTTVTLSMEFEPGVWWTSALTPFMFATKKLGIGRPMRKSLNRLRAQAEQTQTQMAA